MTREDVGAERAATWMIESSVERPSGTVGDGGPVEESKDVAGAFLQGLAEYAG